MEGRKERRTSGLDGWIEDRIRGEVGSPRGRVGGVERKG